MISSAEREKLAARVRALMAKTVENGCTEEEAIAAAAKVAEILERYNLSLDEVEIRQSPFTKKTANVRDDMVGAKLYVVANGIETLTGARYWTARREGVVEIHFFGLSHEVDVARYLLDVCAGAMRRAAREVDSTNMLFRPALRHQRTASFIAGMADRLRNRLVALKPKDPPGQGLVVLKNSLIDQGLADMGIELETKSGHRESLNAAAYEAGVQAGDRVGLNQGLKGPTMTPGVLLG